VRDLAQHVLGYIRRHELIRAGDRVGLAVSGGADSVALLRLMLELRGDLGVGLSVLHFNHQLRGAESDADEHFVSELAARHKLQFLSAAGNVKQYAAKQGLSIEAAARYLRYEYFSGLLRDGAMNRIATAHTLDDQAETVLLRAVRGAGTAGLAGIYPQVLVSECDGSMIRPLLGSHRKHIESYLHELDQPWREDGSNRDLRHARNRLRHGIMPRLARSLNPSVHESLADMAEIARAEEEYWTKEVAKALPEVLRVAGQIQVNQLRRFPLALQRRLVRAAAETVGLRLDFRHVEDVLGVCDGRTKAAPMPKGWLARRAGDELRFGIDDAQAVDYESVLTVPGTTNVDALGSTFTVVLVTEPLDGYPAEHLFDAALLNKELVVRNWRAGDRFWPSHTKGPKKIKELLQDRHVSGPDRKLWPVIVSGLDVLWMRGFLCPAAWQCKPGASRAVLIREVAIESGFGAHDTPTYDADRES
jgi:tRNA(Ile)-lysidine synthase